MKHQTGTAFPQHASKNLHLGRGPEYASAKPKADCGITKLCGKILRGADTPLQEGYLRVVQLVDPSEKQRIAAALQRKAQGFIQDIQPQGLGHQPVGLYTPSDVNSMFRIGARIADIEEFWNKQMKNR